MKKYLVTVQLFLLVLFISGCSQKVTIKALEPAEVDRAAKTKNIAVTNFRNDYVGLSNKIETNLSRYKIETKPFFTIVSRGDTRKIIKEQKLQNSGLVDVSSAVELGNMIGAEALISGRVGNVSSNDTFFYERRSRCADKKCKEFVYYKVGCTKRVFGLSADIRMVDVTMGDIIYADSISRTATYKHCRDDARAFPSRDMVVQKMADSIAEEFTYKLTPHYRYFSVELLEDGDLDYDENQNLLLKSALEYIKLNRFDKAQNLLVSLIDSTDRRSYVPFYNLGVVKEAQGDYIEAKELYEKADSIVIEPNRTISNSILRINSTINKHHITQEQINR